MSKMKGLHENTVSLYINPMLGIVIFITMYYKGLNLTFIYNFTLTDWFLVIFFSISTVIVQTLKFIAL